MTQPEKIRILVVEDEIAIQRGLCDVLAYHGWEPEGASTGDEGLRLALRNTYDLILLDVMLPEISGFEICEQVRSALPQQPILMLTARGSEEDILQGFQLGADDYVTKPFSVSELVARVQALLRRAGKLQAELERDFPFGSWKIDPSRLEAARGEETVPLSQREIDLMRLFSREVGRIVSRRTLLQEVWGFGSVEKIETRTVDMHIAKLRKKLGATGNELIETVRGAGYRFSS